MSHNTNPIIDEFKIRDYQPSNTQNTHQAVNDNNRYQDIMKFLEHEEDTIS